MRILLSFILITTIYKQLHAQIDTTITQYLGRYHKKISFGKILNGRRIGKWETKLDNKILFECFYNWPDSSILYKGFDNEGFIEEQSFKHYKNDTTLISNGYFETYSYNHTGKVLSSGSHKMGKLHGQYTLYFLDTNLIYSKCFFVDGIKVDSSYLLYKNGQIEEIGVYKNGDRIGLWIEYYENGQIRALGNYLGTHKRISVDKIIDVETLDYITTTEHWDYKKGSWKYYLPNGKLYKREEYNENGFLIKCKEIK